VDVLYAGINNQIMNIPTFVLGHFHAATALTTFYTYVLIATAVMGITRSFYGE
jgi:hypothetical protein